MLKVANTEVYVYLQGESQQISYLNLRLNPEGIQSVLVFEIGDTEVIVYLQGGVQQIWGYAATAQSKRVYIVKTHLVVQLGLRLKGSSVSEIDNMIIAINASSGRTHPRNSKLAYASTMRNRRLRPYSVSRQTKQPSSTTATPAKSTLAMQPSNENTCPGILMQLLFRQVAQITTDGLAVQLVLENTLKHLELSVDISRAKPIWDTQGCSVS